MLKTTIFLRKSIFFNTFLVFFMLMGLQTLFAQVSEHGASFKTSAKANSTSDVFQTLQVSENLETQIKGTITEVCQAKGCWMKVRLEDEQEVFVKFKNYGFFVPTDAAGKEVVMNGQAFVEEMSVSDQKHYAEDKGATQEEIQKIKSPKRTLRFEADGVRIATEF